MFCMIFRFALRVVFVVIDGSTSDSLRKLSEDSSRKHLSGGCYRFCKLQM